MGRSTRTPPAAPAPQGIRRGSTDSTAPLFGPQSPFCERGGQSPGPAAPCPSHQWFSDMLPTPAAVPERQTPGPPPSAPEHRTRVLTSPGATPGSHSLSEARLAARMTAAIPTLRLRTAHGRGASPWPQETLCERTRRQRPAHGPLPAQPPLPWRGGLTQSLSTLSRRNYPFPKLSTHFHPLQSACG